MNQLINSTNCHSISYRHFHFNNDFINCYDVKSLNLVENITK